MATIRYTLSVTWNELQLIAKDRTWLAILFLLPLFIASLIGGINVAAQAASQEEDLLKVVLVNEDAGLFGGEIAKAILTISQLDVKTSENPADAEQQVGLGNAVAAILIPADFSQKIDAYTPTEIVVSVDPAQPEAAEIVTGILGQVAGEVVIWGEVQHGVRAILDESGWLAQASQADKRALEAQNLGAIMTQLNELRRSPAISVVVEDLEGAKAEGDFMLYLAYLFPATCVMFLFFIAPMSAGSLWSDRDSGTLRRMLASPLPRPALIAGKMLAYTLLGCLQAAVMLGVANLGFNIPLGRSPLALILTTVLVALNATALGMLVAGIAKNARQSDNLGLVLSFVLAGLGGALPTSPLPTTRATGMMGNLARLTPHGHAVEAYFRLMGENADFAQVLPEIGFLAALLVVLYALAIWRFRFDR